MQIHIVLIKWKGGVGRVVKNQIKELERLGHTVSVTFKDESMGYANYNILYTQDWSCALFNMLKKNHYVCFHGHNPQKLGYIIQTIIGRLKGNKLFVVGDSLKKRFPKSHLLYNAVDKKEFYDLKEERKYLGWIKRDYEEIDEKNAKLIANEEGLELSIAENIPPEKMNEWYNSLKIFMSYPKSFTGFNMCWIEALSSGVPDVRGNNAGVGIWNAKMKYKSLTWKQNVSKLLEVFND